MEINSEFVLNCVLKISFDSDNPSRTMYDQQLCNVTRSTIMKHIVSKICSVDMAVTHPQYVIMQDIKMFENDDNEHDEAYYLSMFIYFLSSMPYIHMDKPFTFMPTNNPVEYIWLCVSDCGQDICMKMNNLEDKFFAFRVLFNNNKKYLFDVENCDRHTTTYGDFLHINGETYDATHPFKSRYCIIIISDENDVIKSMWCNDPYYKDGRRLWKLNYLC